MSANYFYNDRQFQLPQRALYNHDPIYGNEAKVDMNDEDFRTYLFTMAMRGTCFWELYYSYNMMNKATGYTGSVITGGNNNGRG